MPAPSGFLQTSCLFASSMPWVAACTLLKPILRAYATASKKYGLIVGSPPLNCTDIWRRGLIFSALSKISLISSQPTSCTSPTSFASLKHLPPLTSQQFASSPSHPDPPPHPP